MIQGGGCVHFGFHFCGFASRFLLHILISKVQRKREVREDRLVQDSTRNST